MTRLLLFTTMLLLALAAASCRPGVDEGSGGRWRIMQSPVTGYCYEVLQPPESGFRVWGMERVDCSWLGADSE